MGIDDAEEAEGLGVRVAELMHLAAGHVDHVGRADRQPILAQRHLSPPAGPDDHVFVAVMLEGGEASGATSRAAFMGVISFADGMLANCGAWPACGGRPCGSG